MNSSLVAYSLTHVTVLVISRDVREPARDSLGIVKPAHQSSGRVVTSTLPLLRIHDPNYMPSIDVPLPHTNTSV
jgi:hypothetical protein